MIRKTLTILIALVMALPAPMMAVGAACRMPEGPKAAACCCPGHAAMTSCPMRNMAQRTPAASSLSTPDNCCQVRGERTAPATRLAATAPVASLVAVTVERSATAPAAPALRPAIAASPPRDGPPTFLLDCAFRC